MKGESMRIILMLLLCLSSSNLFGEATLNVKENADFRKVNRMAMDIGFGVKVQCMQKLSAEMKAKGASDDEIANELSDTSKTKERDGQCLCRFKSEANEALKELDPILKKHPEWKGKTLVGKAGDMTVKVSVAGLEETKQKVSQCR